MMKAGCVRFIEVDVALQRSVCSEILRGLEQVQIVIDALEEGSAKTRLEIARDAMLAADMRLAENSITTSKAGTSFVKWLTSKLP